MLFISSKKKNVVHVPSKRCLNLDIAGLTIPGSALLLLSRSIPSFELN